MYIALCLLCLEALSLIHCIAAMLLVAPTSLQGQPGGAPPETCGATTDIVPDHGGLSPSDTPLSCSVDFSDFTGGEYIPGDTYLSKKHL